MKDQNGARQEPFVTEISNYVILHKYAGQYTIENFVCGTFQRMKFQKECARAMQHKKFSKLSISLILGLLLVGCTDNTHVQLPANSTAPVSITDDEIRDVLNRVAHHQLHPLKDGDYTSVKDPNALALAQAAAQPDGITWSYPWGVALYGMIRSTDATGDKEVEKFVLDHNQICSRYYTWLTDLRANAGESPQMAELYDKASIHLLLRLGNLDSCGSMGAQTLEGILRHRGQESPEEKVVVPRLSDWIVNNQHRMPTS